MKTKTLIITFSLRKDSESLKVARHLQEISQNAEILNLFENPLPLWDESVWENSEKWSKLLAEPMEKLSKADSYIFVVPEYNGSPSPSYFNFMLFLGGESHHKPALITTISSGRGGSYPVLGVRSFGYKNTKINFIPEHLIIQKVENNEYKMSDFMKEKIAFTLQILDIYATNFKQIRKEVQFDERFEYGM